MFETALAVGRDRSPARRTASLSLALGAQASLLAAFALATLLSPEPIQPPPLMAAGLPDVPVRLTFVAGAHAEKKTAKAPQTPKAPPKDDRLLAPAQSLDHIPPPSDKGPPLEEAQGPEAPQGWIENAGGGTGLGIGPVQPPRRVILPPGATVEIPRLVHQVNPVYPAAASAMRLAGRVVLQIVVNENGAVEDVQVLQSSNPLFVQAAVDAVRQWRYTRPIDQQGQTVACYMVVTVRFVAG